MIIAFIGTDGSGKTTLIRKTTEMLTNDFGKVCLYRHLRPEVLPPIGWWFGKKNEGSSTGVVDDPHGKSPSGKLGSLFRLFYYGIDYTFGYWIRKFTLKTSEALIFDRYMFDIRIDPLRLRIQAPEWGKTLFTKICPKPDIVFCLGGDPEALYARKPETSLEEVSRQVEVLKEISLGKGMYWINTTQSLEESCAEIQLVFAEYKKINQV